MRDGSGTAAFLRPLPLPEVLPKRAPGVVVGSVHGAGGSDFVLERPAVPPEDVVGHIDNAVVVVIAANAEFRRDGKDAAAGEVFIILEHGAAGRAAIGAGGLRHTAETRPLTVSLASSST